MMITLTVIITNSSQNHILCVHKMMSNRLVGMITMIMIIARITVTLMVPTMVMLMVMIMVQLKVMAVMTIETTNNKNTDIQFGLSSRRSSPPAS